MKKNIQNILCITIFLSLMMLSGIAICHRGVWLRPPMDRSTLFRSPIERPTEADYCNGAEVPERLASPAGMQRPYVAGPLAANLGELCVFTLNDPKIRADWTVIRQIDKEPPATFYIDSSGSALTFSSNIAAKYTIVAAINEEGVPRILQHICQYGVNPTPEPEPTPKPQPQPTNLTDWVRQNIPEAGKEQATILASCYESCAQGIEKGTIHTPEAAFSMLRTNTQTKIKLDVWKDFLDKLSEKIGENKDIKALGVIFKEVANGLKTVSEVETKPESPSDTQSRATTKPGASCGPAASWCSDPTGRACRVPSQPRYIYSGGRR